MITQPNYFEVVNVCVVAVVVSVVVAVIIVVVVVVVKTPTTTSIQLKTPSTAGQWDRFMPVSDIDL